MQIIKNDAIAVLVNEDGQGLKMLDLKRGTSWMLDGESVRWGGRITKNEDLDKETIAGLKVLQPLCAAAEGDMLTVTYLANGCPVVFRYSLLPDGVEVRLAPPESLEIEAVSMPGAFTSAGEKMKLLLPIMQGMLWDGRGESFSHVRRAGSHIGFSMQMYGVLGESGALLAAAETGVDSYWWYQKDARGFRVQNLQESSLGTMRYERVMRLYLTSPGIVPVAKRYRRRVQERGRFITWAEKLAERPGLERLFGALICYIGYCQDDLSYAEEFKKLKEYGFDRVLAYPVDFNCYGKDFLMGGLPPIHLTREEIGQIRNMGFDVCPWTWVNEAIDDGTGERANMYKITRDGTRHFGWQIDGFKWYKVCSPEMDAFESKAVDGPFDHMTWDHFDVVACASIGECYAHDHVAHPGRAMPREEDLMWLRKTLVTGQGKAGRQRIVGSENFNDLFSLEYDIGTVKAWPQYGPWGFWPVPLTGLVYHDSIIHNWWEMHSYNNPWSSASVGSPNLYEYGGGRPDLQSAADALMGCPPDVFPFGAQYTWTGRGSETFAFRYRFEDPAVQYALMKALPVAQLHHRIGKLEMTDFQILSDDGWVQRTAFADGTVVTANFGCGRRSDISGAGSLSGQSWTSE